MLMVKQKSEATHPSTGVSLFLCHYILPPVFQTFLDGSLSADHEKADYLTHSEHFLTEMVRSWQWARHTF